MKPFFVGLDLSLRATGVVTIDSKGKIISSNLIKTKPTEGVVAELQRLIEIKDQISILPGVALVAIEGIAFMSGPMATALAQLSGLNYLVRSDLYKNLHRFIIVAPTTLKKFATGKGNCDKNVVMLEVYKRWGESFTDDNLCDAFVLAQIARTLVGAAKPDSKPQEEVVNLLVKQNEINPGKLYG